jgi:carboxyl-terminal processing protease
MTNRKLNVWMPLLFSLVLIAGMIAGYSIKTNFQLPMGTNRSVPLIEVWNLIRQRYVDDVNPDTIGTAAIEEMMKKLDPHSHYISASELQSVNEDLEGRFQGIGIEFSMMKDTLNIVYVIKNGPAEKAGLQVGDKILKAGDSLISGRKLKYDDIRKLLRGEAGSTVTVSFLRSGQLRQANITRDFISLPSIDASYIIEPGTGYIKLNKFSETTYDEFMKAMESLNKEGMKSMILDLRDNGGGVLDAAVAIADEFLDNNKLIVYTEGKHLPRKEYHCKKPGLFETGKLVVLVDETTASASEVLTGALQDWDRATIVGRRTFGKGLVQEQYELSNGSALRLTVARYYTPVGRSIQKPYNNGVEAYEEELIHRYHSAQITNADSNMLTAGKVYKTLIKKRNVYGGGGITPDVFIPLDTSIKNDNFGKIYSKSLISDFVYNYYVNHRNIFASFKKPADLYSNFKIDAATWEDFVSFCLKDSIDIRIMLPKEREYLANTLLSTFARQLWRIEGMTEIRNHFDDEIKKALEEIRKQ